ncbi:MAG: BspA family leucine-rich repeat surface protein, partial [Erysipelotrichaceae bacterium]|nr:BspA family leucine-rich repeat surface protein [Erysipelotrichaceae bacterium]
MNAKFLKILISTAAMIPSFQTAVLANSTSNEADSAVITELSGDLNHPGSAMVDADLEGGFEKNEAQKETEGAAEYVDDRAAYSLHENVLASGTAGVKWVIDTDLVLHFEAGKLNREDNWKAFQGGIREIRVIPNEKYDKLILPADSKLLFSCLSSLTEIDISRLDASSVENMDVMFGSCTSLKNLDLSTFDTSNVT